LFGWLSGWVGLGWLPGKGNPDKKDRKDKKHNKTKKTTQTSRPGGMREAIKSAAPGGV
jgi:hypothetical protein